MTLLELKKKIAEKNGRQPLKVTEVIQLIDEEISSVTLRWDELKSDFKESHAPRAIHEIKGREDELCKILGEKPKLGRLPEPSGW